MKRGECLEAPVSKNELAQDCVPKNEIEKYWISKQDVRTNYINNNDLKEKYIPKDEVNRLWFPKKTVEKEYVLKTVCQQTIDNQRPTDRGPKPVINPTSDETEEEDFSMRLLQCYSRSTKVVCQLSVTNEGEERQLLLAGKLYPPATRIFDLQGNEYQPESITLGSSEGGGGAQILMPIGVPVKAQISFEGVQRDLTSIALLEVQCATWGQKSNNRKIAFRFRHVRVGNH